jgi:hypothetical protein
MGFLQLDSDREPWVSSNTVRSTCAVSRYQKFLVKDSGHLSCMKKNQRHRVGLPVPSWATNLDSVLGGGPGQGEVLSLCTEKKQSTAERVHELGRSVTGTKTSRCRGSGRGRREGHRPAMGMVPAGRLGIGPHSPARSLVQDAHKLLQSFLPSGLPPAKLRRKAAPRCRGPRGQLKPVQLTL